jgi:hypothetical protein
MNWLVAIGAAAALLYASVCGLLYVSQRSMLYFPTPESHNALARAIYLPNDGTPLKIWHLPNASNDAIVYFGGNAEDVAWNIPSFAAAFPATAVYFVNYRGYGGSAGAPSEAALFADALAVFDHVRVMHERVAVIGRSLGSGVAMHLASVRPVHKLVLVSPYDSVLNVAQSYLSLFPVSLLLKDRYDSLSLAARIGVPVLVLLAEQDRVIPRAHSERLLTAFAKGLVEVKVIAGASHDSIGAAAEYHAALHAFLLADER